MSSVRSMTGFAAGEGSFGDQAGFRLTIKGVNHRFLDLHFRFPQGFDALEATLRTALKQRLQRGHVELTLDLARASSGTVRLNEDALRELLGALRSVAAKLGITGEPDLGSLLRVPGVLTTEARSERPAEADGVSAVMPVFDRVLDAFEAAREAEGAVLAQELRGSIVRLHAACEGVLTLRSGVRQAHFERLRDRLKELLPGTAVSGDRLLAEAALLAEKSDVEEEAVRLRAHLDSFTAILAEGGAVGKRLDFLLQELNREANTLLSKTGSASGPDSLALTELGLAMKTEIERAREQVQNLE